METNQNPPKGSLISAMFLVAGCCIGGGMLALPVGSGPGGFIPSLVMMTLCWAMMTISALLLVEVSLWMEKGAHVITMTSKILGPIGKGVAWVLFLYISYASQVAYAAGGGIQVAALLNNYMGTDLSKDVGAAILTIILSGVIVFGGRFVGRVNSVFFVALIMAYFALVTMGTGNIDTSLLFYKRWSAAWLAIPLLLTSFSFQTMVPSLTPILRRHTGALKGAIIGGTTIAFIVYAVWQYLILGIIPVEGPYGLVHANLESVPATRFLDQHVVHPLFIYTAEFFGFFAIITSFLAMGLGLYDFLSDGLGIKEKGSGKIILWLLIVIPTILFAVKFERAFMLALDTSGGFCDTILNGMIPVMMVWIGRYKLGYSDTFRVPGGKYLLVPVFCFFFACLLLEIFVVTGILPSGYELYDILKIHTTDKI